MYGVVFDPEMRPYPPRVALAPQTPANQRSASEFGLSTLRATVSTRGATYFVLGLLELYKHVWSSF